MLGGRRQDGGDEEFISGRDQSAYLVGGGRGPRAGSTGLRAFVAWIPLGSLQKIDSGQGWQRTAERASGFAPLEALKSAWRADLSVQVKVGSRSRV